MKKTSPHLLWALVALAVLGTFSSCSKKECSNCNGPTVPVQCTFTAPNTINIGADGVTDSFELTASSSGCVCNSPAQSSDTSWLTVSGAGSKVTYTAKPFTGTQRSAAISTCGGLTTVIQKGNPPPTTCTYAAIPTEAHVDCNDGDGSFAVVVNGTCLLSTPTTDVPWLTATTSCATCTDVHYHKSRNDTGAQRIGHITVNGCIFTVTQDACPVQPPPACFFTIDQGSTLHFACPGGTQTIKVTTNRSDCGWKVTGLPSWLIASTTDWVMGTGTVTITAIQNGTSYRAVTIEVAGQPVPIDQDACSTPPPPPPTTYYATGTCTRTATATRTCPSGTTVTGSGTATQSGTGSSTVSQADAQAKADANACANAQTAAQAAADADAQAKLASCPPVTFTANATCTRTATATRTCPSGTTVTGSGTATQSGTGSSTVSQADAQAKADANACANAQTAAQAAADADAQAKLASCPASCSLTAPSSVPSISYQGTSNGSVVISVTAGNPWSASSASPFVHVMNGSGVGNGAVTFTVDPNSAASRTGTIVITACGQSVNVSVPQDGAPPPPPPSCDFLVPPEVPQVSYSGTSNGSVIFQSTTQSNCSWTASDDAGWITLSATSGNCQSCSIQFTVGGNPGAARIGHITITSGGGNSHVVSVPQQAYQP